MIALERMIAAIQNNQIAAHFKAATLFVHCNILILTRLTGDL